MRQRSEPSPGADAAAVSPVAAQMRQGGAEYLGAQALHPPDHVLARLGAKQEILERARVDPALPQQA